MTMSTPGHKSFSTGCFQLFSQLKFISIYTINYISQHFNEKDYTQKYIKHCENHKTLPREHLIGYQGVKTYLLKDHFKVFFFIDLDLS